MNLHVSLYGTLSRDVPGYCHTTGLAVEIADGSTAGELLAHLQIPPNRGSVVAAGGRILNMDDRIIESSHVKVFQTVHGG